MTCYIKLSKSIRLFLVLGKSFEKERPIKTVMVNEKVTFDDSFGNSNASCQFPQQLVHARKLEIVWTGFY